MLPGEPDNIRPSPRGYWVAFTSARNYTNPVFMDELNAYPTVKYIWGRFHHACGTIMTALAELSTLPSLKEFAYRVSDYSQQLVPKYRTVRFDFCVV